MSAFGQSIGNFQATLIPTTTISTAVSIVAGPVTVVGTPAKYLTAQAKFLYGAGGTNVTVYVQTSIDGGVSWIDVMSFQFTTAAATKVSACSLDVALAAAVTPTSGSLTANTILNGLLGNQFRAQYVTTGTYSGATSIRVDIVTKG